MTQFLSVRTKQPDKIRQYIIAFLLCCIMPSGLADALPMLAEKQSTAKKSAETFYWLHRTSPCTQKAKERLLIQGFAQDWHTLATCQNPHALWWALDLKPKVKRPPKNKKTAEKPDKNDIAFEFKSDFITRLEKLTEERYTGPPKWMPPALAYWDPAIGDWRYLKTNLDRHANEQQTGTELVMFWIKYDEGIIWDATFDYGRFLELFNFAQYRLDSLTAKLFSLLHAKD